MFYLNVEHILLSLFSSSFDLHLCIQSACSNAILHIVPRPRLANDPTLRCSLIVLPRWLPCSLIVVPHWWNIFTADLRSRLHRDPALWEEPERFDAHRFLRKTEHGKRRHLYQFMAVRVRACE